MDKNKETIISASPGLGINLTELWRYSDLVLLFVRRDFVSNFKQTLLGPLWFFIHPLLTAVTFTFIFGKVARFSTDGLPFILFYLSGLVVWNYFQECFLKSSEVFITNQGVFGKVYFPRLAVPVSIMISCLMKMVIQFILFFAFWLYYFIQGNVSYPSWAITLIPFLVLLIMGTSFSLGIIFSSLTTKYRDLVFLVHFGIQLLMYATPVIYPSSMVPEQYQSYLFYNPISHIVEAMRFALLNKGTLSWDGLGYSCLFMLVSMIVGLVIFNNVERKFMDTI